MLFTNRSRLLLGSSIVFLSLGASIGQIQRAEAVGITFDYTYDTNNFFDPNTTVGQQRRTTLTQAGNYFTDYISDSLLAIENNPSSPTGIGYGSNTWTADFFHPGTGSIQSITNLTVPTDTIIIYAGGRDFDPLGEGGRGGFTIPPGTTTEFTNLIKGRGQDGALTDTKTDIGLWGGSIAFDTNIVIDIDDTPTNFDWHNTVEITEENPLSFNEYDFLSVAIHELAHVFGYTSTLDSSWGRHITPNTTEFTGPESLAVYQAETDPSATYVPLESGSLSHWQDGTTSFTLDGDSQEVALDPNIFNGQRKLLTNLDYAGLEDIGWDVNTATIPFEFSPSLGILVVAGMFGTKKVWNARKVKQSAVE
ncbi:MAG: hypothetical protein AB4368_16370 [Xenococcaceae cyanobacterium]